LNNNYLLTSEDGSEVYVFDASTGRHLKTVKPLTGALLYAFGYNASGHVVTVTDGSGNVTAIHRDGSEHPTAIVSPYGQTTALGLDGNGFLNRVTDRLGKSVTFTNTSTDLLIARTDKNGNVYKYTYDGQGRLAKDADPAGGHITLARTDAASGLAFTVAETTALGRASAYQTNLHLPWVDDGTATSSEQLRNTWPSGLQATKAQTKESGQLSKNITLPDGTSSSATLVPDQVWGLQVPIAKSQTLTRGNLTMNLGATRTTMLRTPGNPFSVATRTNTETINGRTYTSAFTGSNHTYVNKSPMGRTVTVGLDSLERIHSMQVEGLTATDFAYDSRGRLASATTGPRTTTFSYNSNGFLASITDPLQLKRSYTYDADGHVLATTLPDGRVITYGYDANGNLTAVTPPGKPAHDFAYTAVNLLSAYTPPKVSGTGATTYTYDPDRDLMSIIRPDGGTIKFGYDTAGRLVSIGTPTETSTLYLQPGHRQSGDRGQRERAHRL
jgi:YD repeat-containing protein